MLLPSPEQQKPVNTTPDRHFRSTSNMDSLSMDKYAHSLPSLRKMTSLSYHPPTSRSSTKRSPNTTLSRRSAVMKPLTSHNSPSHSYQRRRLPQAQAARMTRPFTYHAANEMSMQASQFPQDVYYNSNNKPISRPMTWHPMQNSSMAPPQRSSTGTNFDVHQNNYQNGWNNSMWNAPGYQVPANNMMDSTYQDHNQIDYPTQQTAWYDESPPASAFDGNAIPINQLNIQQYPVNAQTQQNTYVNPSYNAYVPPAPQTAPQLHNVYQHGGYGDLVNTVATATRSGNEKDQLIGMGLHDRSTNYEQTSLLLGAGLDEHEKPSSKPSGLSTLTSEWSPPQEVPDTIPDEDDDTPLTNDFNDIDQSAMTPENVMQPFAHFNQFDAWGQPQYVNDLSGQSFYFEDTNEINPNQWYAPAEKTMPTDGSGGNMWGWMGMHNQY